MDVAVVVAGAGPTGLALACGLLSQGADVRVVDRASAPATTSRALVVQARGAEVLDRLGALGDLPEHANPIQRIRLHVDGVEAATLPLNALPEAAPLVISQAEVEKRLRERLEELGGTVEWGVAVASAVPEPGGVRVGLETGETVRAGWLVGCDGARSRVRELSGVDFPGAPLGELFLLADVHADLGSDRTGTLGWLHREGFTVAFPLPDAPDLWRIIADMPAQKRIDHDEVTRVLGEVLVRRAGLGDAVLGRARWTSVFRLRRGLADRYRAGRQLLAGDAAHIHSPLGGQGMNVGLGDAENLAWKLALVAGGLAEESLLDTYEAERRPVASDVVAGTTLLTRAVLAPGPFARLLVGRVVGPLAGLPVAQRRVMRTASQLATSYRHGPLARPLSLRPGLGLRPGDRVPDLACLRVDGTGTRLHAELRGRWAFLVPREPVRGRPGSVGEVRSLVGGRLAVLGHDDGEVMLVRPDAHLAWRGRDPAGASAWLRHALGRP
jgi:4,5-epoxidase